MTVIYTVVSTVEFKNKENQWKIAVKLADTLIDAEMWQIQGESL